MTQFASLQLLWKSSAWSPNGSRDMHEIFLYKLYMSWKSLDFHLNNQFEQDCFEWHLRINMKCTSIQSTKLTIKEKNVFWTSQNLAARQRGNQAFKKELKHFFTQWNYSEWQHCCNDNQMISEMEEAREHRRNTDSFAHQIINSECVSWD